MQFPAALDHFHVLRPHFSLKLHATVHNISYLWQPQINTGNCEKIKKIFNEANRSYLFSTRHGLSVFRPLDKFRLYEKPGVLNPGNFGLESK